MPGCSCHVSVHTITQSWWGQKTRLGKTKIPPYASLFLYGCYSSLPSNIVLQISLHPLLFLFSLFTAGSSCFTITVWLIGLLCFCSPTSSSLPPMPPLLSSLPVSWLPEVYSMSVWVTLKRPKKKKRKFFLFCFFAVDLYREVHSFGFPSFKKKITPEELNMSKIDAIRLQQNK